MPMWLIWILLMLVFLVFEAATMGLTTIWCAVGCLVASVMAACGAPMWAQIAAMVTISVILFVLFLVWIKPKMADLKNTEKIPTNADRIIGEEGIVIEDIVPIDNKGQIKVMGQVWSAQAEHVIPEGSLVKVTGLNGVHATVEVLKYSKINKGE